MADEARIESDIIREYGRNGWSARHVEPDQHTPPGWPDVEALGPERRIVFIEVKDPSDPEPDPIQLWCHKQLLKLGHVVIVATCVEDAMGPLRRTNDECTG